MRIKSILLLLVCFLLSGFTMSAIACLPPYCGSCCHWVSTGPGPSDGYCELDAECGDCRGCYNPCYSCVSCYCERDCSPTQSCCTDSGDYCCESNETCCEGNCCATGQCCNDGTCVDTCPTCKDCDSGTCKPIKVSSVTSDNGACVNCSITFTAITNPSGNEDDVSWSGGGNPSTGSGSTFTTYWDTTGTKTVTASLCSTSKSKDVTVAEPTNFHFVEWWDLGGGELFICYEWDSTSGNCDDLEGCDVGEIVIYPGGDPYVPPDPPFDNWTFTNPIFLWKDATSGYFYDWHRKAGGFGTPYCQRSFTGNQWYRYRNCLGTVNDLLGPIEIIRQVYELTGDWFYSTIKEDAWATTPLP